MTTVSKDFADNIARHQGWYNGDSDNSLGDNPRVARIVEYINAWGGTAYGLVFEGCPDKYTPSAYVRCPRVYWQLREAYTASAPPSPPQKEARDGDDA